MKSPERNDYETVLDNEIIRKIEGSADPLSYDAKERLEIVKNTNTTLLELAKNGANDRKRPIPKDDAARDFFEFLGQQLGRL